MPSNVSVLVKIVTNFVWLYMILKRRFQVTIYYLCRYPVPCGRIWEKVCSQDRNNLAEMYVIFLSSHYLRHNLTFSQDCCWKLFMSLSGCEGHIFAHNSKYNLNLYWLSLVTGTSLSSSKTLSQPPSILESFENLGTTNMQFMYPSKIHSCRVHLQWDTDKVQGLGQRMILFIFTWFAWYKHRIREKRILLYFSEGHTVCPLHSPSHHVLVCCHPAGRECCWNHCHCLFSII